MTSGADVSRGATGRTLAGLHVLADGLIERPDPALDDALNAATACFVRHGLAHTSVRDVAAELGVSKATVYRQVGSVQDLARTLLARDVHRLIDAVADSVGDATGPEAVVQLVTAAGQFICEHPLVRKVVAEEPQLAGDLLAFLPVAADTITEVLAAVIAEVQPGPGPSAARVVAELAVRLVTSAVLLPSDDLPALLGDALRPHLAP